MINYPKTQKEFINWYSSYEEYKNIYLSMNKHKLFDVSLRDGLQSLSLVEQQNFTLTNKINLYNKIITEHNPFSLEIGSIVSPKILPIMSDSLQLFDYVDKINNNIYILFPNKEKLVILNNMNYSLITSVSESFQKKNIKKSIDETKKDIIDSINLIKDNNKKIYISCINECPIEGKINNDFIIDEILYYNQLKINNICLSDTCGSLEYEDFKYILEKCIENDIEIKKISLHLHIDYDNLDNIEKILFLAFEKGIVQYDVSLIESGGCSITMNKNKLKNNLSYDIYYKCLVNYIISKSY